MSIAMWIIIDKMLMGVLLAVKVVKVPFTVGIRCITSSY